MSHQAAVTEPEGRMSMYVWDRYAFQEASLNHALDVVITIDSQTVIPEAPMRTSVVTFRRSVLCGEFVTSLERQPEIPTSLNAEKCKYARDLNIIQIAAVSQHLGFVSV